MEYICTDNIYFVKPYVSSSQFFPENENIEVQILYYGYQLIVSNKY